MRPHWLDSVVEAVTVDVVTTVEVAVDEVASVDTEVTTDVVVVEDADELVVGDARVSAEVVSVVTVGPVDIADDVEIEPVDIIEDVEDNISVVSVEEAVVASKDEVDGVNVVVGSVVKVELSTGLYLTALAFIFVIIPIIAKESMSINTIRREPDFT